MDPKEKTRFKIAVNKFFVTIRGFILSINPYLLLFGLVSSVTLFGITQEKAHLIWVTINSFLIGVYLLFVIRDRTRWGITVDINGKILPGIKVNLYERKYNKLVDTRISDEFGRFQFLVPGNKYILKPSGAVIEEAYSKPGYLVGKLTEKNIFISQKMVLRKL